MAEAILGLDLDIHGGGLDLVFPHHENEIAQTEAARAAPLARIWMHNGMVRTDGEKMAKSVGNIFALHSALDEYGREALLMYFAGGHYRQPLVFSPDALADAGRAAERVRELCRRLDPGGAAPPALAPFRERFFDRLAEDYNTAAARAELFDWVAEANRSLDRGERLGVGGFREMLSMLGLEGLLDQLADVAGPDEERLLAEREEARSARDFAAADARRDELAARGWEVRDTPAGPQLVRVR